MLSITLYICSLDPFCSAVLCSSGSHYVQALSFYSLTSPYTLHTLQVAATLEASDNYRVRDFNVTLTPATSVSLRSSAEFRLYDLGAVGQAGCVERLYVDMGAQRHVRVIRTRHWAGGHGLMSKLIASDDGATWQTLSDLDPNAVHPAVTYLPSTMTFRYVGVEHREDESKYAKVSSARGQSSGAV